MQRARSLVAIVVALLAIGSGCSTVPTAIPKLSGPAIVFVRDSGFVAGGCTFAVLVDGETVGQVDAGQSLVKQVRAGKHRVAIDNTSALCPNVRMSKVVDVTTSPVVLRIGITSNFQTIFDQVE